jgi:hypothetical protein
LGGEALEFQAPLPADLAGALAGWGLRYNDSQWLTSHAPSPAVAGAAQPRLPTAQRDKK